jgi:hypothetical protein
MVEYGGAINNGPAGQVGGAGAPHLGGSNDLFASVGNIIHDATNMVTTAPPEMLVLGIVIFFVGLIVLKRAF